MPKECPHVLPVQVWGPDALTVAAVDSLDVLHGLSMSGAGADASLRPGLSGMNESGTGYGGELGALQTFGVVGAGAAPMLPPAMLPASAGINAGPTPIRALLASQPI